jgi:hypothetical protein
MATVFPQAKPRILADPGVRLLPELQRPVLWMESLAPIFLPEPKLAMMILPYDDRITTLDDYRILTSDGSPLTSDGEALTW